MGGRPSRREHTTALRGNADLHLADGTRTDMRTSAGRQRSRLHRLLAVPTRPGHTPVLTIAPRQPEGLPKLLPFEGASTQIGAHATPCCHTPSRGARAWHPLTNAMDTIIAGALHCDSR